MRKKIIFICLSLFLLSPIKCMSYYVNNVFDVSLEGSHSINNDEEITIDIKVDVSYNLGSILGELGYDQSKIKLTKCKSDYFTCSYKDKLLLDSVEGIKGEKVVAKLTFEVLDGFKPGDDVKATFTNVEGNNNTRGNNSEFKIHRLQNDTTLTSLGVKNETMTPEFSPTNTTYKVSTTSSTVNLVATSNSKISGIGEKIVDYGNNIFEIKVTAETGEEKTYYVNVFRTKESTNTNNNTSNSGSTGNNSINESTLSSNKRFKFLSIDGVNFVFKNDILEYNIDIDSDIKNLKINYELEDEKSKVIISGDTTFTKTNSTITISVIAEDGSQTDYNIHINKKSDNKVVSVGNTSKNDEDTTETQDNEKANISLIILIILCGFFVILFAFLKRNKSNQYLLI